MNSKRGVMYPSEGVLAGPEERGAKGGVLASGLPLLQQIGCWHLNLSGWVSKPHSPISFLCLSSSPFLSIPVLHHFLIMLPLNFEVQMMVVVIKGDPDGYSLSCKCRLVVICFKAFSFQIFLSASIYFLGGCVCLCAGRGCS